MTGSNVKVQDIDISKIQNGFRISGLLNNGKKFYIVIGSDEESDSPFGDDFDDLDDEEVDNSALDDFEEFEEFE